MAHPDILLKSLTSEQLAEWAAFFALEPDESARSDYIAAQGVALQYNLHRGKDDPPIEPVEFMPWVDKPEKTAPKKLSDIEAARAQAAFFGREG